MGASQSHNVVQRTSMEEEKSPPTRPPPPPPSMQRMETFEEKLYRKFTQEPLIPIGCMVTAYFLASGIRSFYNRDPARSQKMMRARVGAQFATLLIFVGYAGMSNFDLRLAPMYQDGKKAKRQQQERQQQEEEEEEGK